MRAWELLAAHLLLFIGGVNYCIDLLDFWLGKEAKRNLQSKLAETWFSFASSDPLIVVQMPLQILSAGFDKIYGKQLLSWKAYWRSSFASTCILISTLAVVGVFNGKLLGIDVFPWSTFDTYVTVFEKVEKDPKVKDALQPFLTAPQRFQAAAQTASTAGISQHRRSDAAPERSKQSQLSQITGSPSPTPWIPETKEQAEMAAKYAKYFTDAARFLSRYDTPFWRTLYSVLFFASVFLVSSVLSFVSLSLARAITREMILARTRIARIALIVFDITILAVVYLICLMIVCFVAYPLGALISGSLLILGLNVNIPFALTLMVPCVLVALWFGPVWIKVVSLIAGLPTALLLFTSWLAAVVFDFRFKVHSWIAHVLDLASQHEKGALGFAKAALGGLAILLAIIAKRWGGFS